MQQKTSRNPKKYLITFITSGYIFLCKSKISISKGAKISYRLENYNNSTSMFIVHVIIVLKVSNNNQQPLDWFNTHVETTRLKAHVFMSTIVHIWALGTFYYKTTYFCLP